MCYSNLGLGSGFRNECGGATYEAPVTVQVELWQVMWIGHKMRKDSSVIKEEGLIWNIREQSRRGRPKGGCRRMKGRRWNNGKNLDRGQRIDGRDRWIVGLMLQSRVTGQWLIHSLTHSLTSEITGRRCRWPFSRCLPVKNTLWRSTVVSW